MSVRWTFVRHGESTANAEGTIAGHRDVDLTRLGQDQARSLAASLADVPFDRVLVSDLKRAHRTAQLAMPGRTLLVRQGLRERSMGDWEQWPREKLPDPSVLLHHEGRPPGGESLADVLTRVLVTLAAEEDGTDTLVVCHGGVMRVLLGLLDGQEREEAARVRYPNCALQTRALGLTALRDAAEANASAGG